MNKAALARLAHLADVRKSRDLAQVEALLVEKARLEEAILALSGTQVRDAAEGEMPFSMIAQRTAWTEAQIAAHERRIGAIAIELAGARAAARVSLGKHEAILRLVKRAEGEEAAGRARAEELVRFAAGQSTTPLRR